MPKKRIYHYVFDTTKVLGSGNFGTVYLGRYIFSEEKVAIKALDKRSIDKNPYLKESLLLEVKTLKKIRSEHTVGFRDVIESENYYYIVQEYCNGGDFEQFLKKKGKIPEKQAIGYMIQILKGFYDIVSLGYIHRDFKPQNVLINDGVLKIADFGLARPSNEEVELRSEVGTPLYESPQTLKGESYNYKCDIWAIGVVFYEMLYGTLPWEKGKGKVTYLNNILTKSVQFPEDVEVSEGMKSFLKKCLQIEENLRSEWEEIFKCGLFEGKLPKFQVLEQMFSYFIKQINVCIQQKKQTLQELFHSFKDKKIRNWKNLPMTRKEFNKMIEKIAPEIRSKTHIEFIIWKFDKDLSENIDVNEFVRTIHQHQDSLKMQTMNNKEMKVVMLRWIKDNEEELEKKRNEMWSILSQRLSKKYAEQQLDSYMLFSRYKTQSSGPQSQKTLGRGEFEKLLRSIDKTLTADECFFLFKEFDTNGDQSIEIKEFFDHMDRLVHKD